MGAFGAQAWGTSSGKALHPLCMLAQLQPHRSLDPCTGEPDRACSSTLCSAAAQPVLYTRRTPPPPPHHTAAPVLPHRHSLTVASAARTHDPPPHRRSERVVFGRDLAHKVVPDQRHPLHDVLAHARHLGEEEEGEGAGDAGEGGGRRAAAGRTEQCQLVVVVVVVRSCFGCLQRGFGRTRAIAARPRGEERERGGGAEAGRTTSSRGPR